MKHDWKMVSFMNFPTEKNVGRRLPEYPIFLVEDKFYYFFPVCAFCMKTEKNSHETWS